MFLSLIISYLLPQRSLSAFWEVRRDHVLGESVCYRKLGFTDSWSARWGWNDAPVIIYWMMHQFAIVWKKWLSLGSDCRVAKSKWQNIIDSIKLKLNLSPLPATLYCLETHFMVSFCGAFCGGPVVGLSCTCRAHRKQLHNLKWLIDWLKSSTSCNFLSKIVGIATLSYCVPWLLFPSRM